MISQDMISDEHFNSISIEAQCVFVRMLAVSDDCGVVPANTYKLNVLINTPQKIAKRLQSLVDEIVNAGLGNRFEYENEHFFAFKRKSFQDYQSYILQKATKSEYLRIPKDEFDEISKNFQEVLGIVIHNDESALCTVESREYRAESKEYKVESKKQKEGFASESCESILAKWNEFAKETGLSEVRALSPKRRAGILSRQKEPEFNLDEIFTKIRESDFLRGQNDNGWKVDFDFVFCSANNYLKIIEGKYANNQGRTRKAVDPNSVAARASFRHGPEQLRRLEELTESLKQSDRERRERA